MDVNRSLPTTAGVALSSATMVVMVPPEFWPVVIHPVDESASENGGEKSGQGH